MNDERGDKDVALGKESDMSSRQSLEYVNKKYDPVDEFDASTCPGDHFYDTFEHEEERITVDSIVWINTNKTIWGDRVIKSSSRKFPEISNYLKLIWINTKKKIGFWVEIVPKNTNTKGFIFQLRDTRMDGHGEISVGYHRHVEKYETWNDKNRCKGYWKKFCC